ncbi:MAG: hypothetical protein VX012_01650 [Planctomycetota bacterium]|nr:hypothetical protein [Planctomycetota bacterium]
MPSAPKLRRGNAIIVVVILVAIVVAAAVAIVVAERGSAIEQRAQDSNLPIRSLDSLLRPVAEWASAGITGWSKANDGKLPSNEEGNKLIAGLGDRPVVEQASNFTANPVYRRMGEKNYEIVVASADLDAGAHLAYPFAADGRSLAPVADANFLEANEEERDGLVATPGAGTDPR